MVFAHLAVYFLNKYLGDYIENLDTKHLKISLWHGDLVLKNLSLKHDALANLDLPFNVATSYLHELSMHIPWQHIHTHPTKVHIDGVYLLLTPKTDIKYDRERDEQNQYESKMKEVHKIEQFRKQREEYQNSQKITKRKDTFFERLEIHILRNLELSISNFHIAFEDEVTKPECPFAFGITFNYIKLFTTNVEWEPLVEKEDAPVMYKVGELNKLSIYWNSNTKTRLEFKSEDIDDFLQINIIEHGSKSDKQLTYILQPLNIQAKLKIATASSEQHYVRPVVDAQVDLEQISFNIDRNQYSDLLDLLEFQDQMDLKSKFVKYYAMIGNEAIDKPSLRRWKFAYTAILHEEIRPRLSSYKWENIKSHRDRVREYHKVYFHLLNGHKSKKQQHHAQELEKKIDVFNLIYIRRRTEIEIIKKKTEHKDQSWWDRFTGLLKHDSKHENSEFTLDNAMMANEKKKLYDAIGYSEDKRSLNYPEEYVDIDLSVRLHMLELNVWSNINDNDTQFKVIATIVVPDAGLNFKRRPAKPAFLIIADLTTCQVFGVQQIDDNRPVLVEQRTQLEQKNLLHIEYETNPVDKPSDNRIRIFLQSLAITYDAFTVNKIVDCFQPDKKRNLQGIKEVAYSTFDDVKYQSHFFFNYSLKNIQATDIDIDLQSSYFLLPENGIYQRSCTIMCLDFGHFIFKGGPSYSETEAEISSQDITVISDTPQSTYFPLNLKLEDIQLLYANQDDDWYNARILRDSPFHLIKPISIYLNIHKCNYVDNMVLPAWKIDIQITDIDGRVSDTRMIGIVKLIQSIPLPELKKDDVETEIRVQTNTFKVNVPRKNMKKNIETVENMAHVQKILEEAASTEIDNQASKKIAKKNQIIELEATFELSRVNLLIEETTSELLQCVRPFVNISIISLVARTTMKTFDIDFDISLSDLNITHEQFLTTSNTSLRLVSIEHHPNQDNKHLISIQGLLTSSVNPSFDSAPYNSIENQARLHIAKPVLMLQLEPFVSIIQFKNNVMEKISQEQHQIPAKRSTQQQVIKKDSRTTIPTFRFEANLEGLRAIIGSEYSQILDINFQDLHFDALNSKEQTAVNIILADFYVYDSNPKARFHKIISQQGNEKQLLRMNLSLYNYPKKYQMTLDDVDCDLKLQLTKLNIIFLYKHIDLVLNIIDIWETKTSIQKPPSDPNQPSTVSKTMEKFQEQVLKLRLDATFNAPSILIPINSSSNEGLFIDLGQLLIQTKFSDDPTCLLVEEQVITVKNLLTSRVHLSKTNEIVADINLLECAELHVLIDRLLYPDQVFDQSQISIKAYWDTIQFILAKDDYACIMKVLDENFSETIQQRASKPPFTKVQTGSISKQEKVVVIDSKQPDRPITEQLRIDAKIKIIGLKLYLGDSKIRSRNTSRNENLKFVDLRLEICEAHFHQLSNSSYTAQAQIHGLILDDLREADRPNNVTRLIDRSSKVDSNTPILDVKLDCTPKDEQHSKGVQQGRRK
ncbi:unnamed protein product [Adineta steineri]|uniref:Chorein N-terminal domain-containing protein n=1 Tax=Adineta steineri TaxID=433720 RepID=A0A819MFU7_9BILA|nr:unnamed protein product [Adineta steineri]